MHDHQAKNNLDFSGESKAGPQKNVTSVVEDIKAFTSQNIAEAPAQALSARRSVVCAAPFVRARISADACRMPFTLSLVEVQAQIICHHACLDWPFL